MTYGTHCPACGEFVPEGDTKNKDIHFHLNPCGLCDKCWNNLLNLLRNEGAK